MNSETEVSGLIRALREAFNLAESEIYKVETVTGQSPVAALNELRYAGAHMLVYIQEGDTEELRQAVMHGRRAYYDAQRFMLLFLMRDAQAIRDGIGENIGLYIEIVAKVYGDKRYGQVKEALHAAMSYIRQMAQIKTDGTRWQKRDVSFTVCKPHIQALKDYIEMYDTLLEEFMNAVALAGAQKKKERRNFILTVVGLSVTILGAMAAILSAIFSLK